MLKLDYTLETPEERNELVTKIVEENPDLPESYLEILANYLIFCMEKQEKKQKKILTDNRLITVNKRETSYEGLVSQLENGEDGIYNLISTDKQTIFQPKVTITKKDLEEIPCLQQLRNAINDWEKRLRTATGKDAFIIKKGLIEMRKEQYIIRIAYRKPITPNKLTHSTHGVSLEDTTHEFDEEGFPIPEGISLMDWRVCSAILCNYSKLKQDSWDRLTEDTWYLIYDFECLCDAAFADDPILMRLIELKIDGARNQDIQRILQEEFAVTHSLEYISNLWRNKIPRMIASQAEDQYLNWYYLNVEKGVYKTCNKCGQVKLAHAKYFSRNKTSKDGWYSICKECRNKKKKMSLGKTC